MLWRLALSVLLIADGAYSLLRNERGDLLRESVEDLLGERADPYLVAGLLGLVEIGLGLWLLVRAALPRTAPRGPSR